MELRDLRVFVAVVESGSMTRAAASLHIVQSTVSQAIQRLERQAGVQLLTRGPLGVTATVPGETLLERARLILEQVEETERQLAMHSGLTRGRLTLGLLPSITPIVLSGLLRELHRLHPALEVRIEEGLAGELQGAVRVGRLDAALLWLPAGGKGLVTQPLQRIPLALVLASDHALSDAGPIALSELDGQDWVAFPSGGPGRGWIEHACLEAGFSPQVAAQVETLAELVAFLQAGWGISFLPVATVAAEIRAGTVGTLSLSDARPSAALGITYRRGSNGPAVRALLDAACTALSGAATYTEEAKPARRAAAAATGGQDRRSLLSTACVYRQNVR